MQRKCIMGNFQDAPHRTLCLIATSVWKLQPQSIMGQQKRGRIMSWGFFFLTEITCRGREKNSHRRPTSDSMKRAQNDNRRVKIMRMGTWLFIIYDPSKATSQSNHHMQRALQNHVNACSLPLMGGSTETTKAARYNPSSAIRPVVWSCSKACLLQNYTKTSFLFTSGLSNNNWTSFRGGSQTWVYALSICLPK